MTINPDGLALPPAAGAVRKTDISNIEMSALFNLNYYKKSVTAEKDCTFCCERLELYKEI